MTHSVRITAQYEENYADDFENQDYWKPKGGHVFTMEVPEEFRFLDEEAQVEFFKWLVIKDNNRCMRFTYLSHEYSSRETKIQWEEKFAAIASHFQSGLA